MNSRIECSPHVSIIVACRNAQSWIEPCIESLLVQTASDFEILIADDCSEDDTWSILQDLARSDPRIRVMQNASRLYAGATRNRCLKEAQGEYVAIQDADDISVPTRIETLVSELEANDVSFVSSGFYLFDDEGVHKTVVPERRIPSRRAFLNGSPFCHAATLFRRKCLEDVKGYRVGADTVRGQDYDLFMKLYAHGHTGLNIPNVLYGYRVDEGTLSRRTFRHRLDECRIRARGFRELGMMPWAAPFVLKPILAHLVRGRGSR